jgi:hypothetical protein
LVCARSAPHNNHRGAAISTADSGPCRQLHGRGRTHRTAAAGALLLTGMLAGCGSAPSPEEVIAAHSATLGRYCLDCHNQAEQAGDLSLERVDLADLGYHAGALEEVVRKLRGRLMPPPGNPQLPDDTLWSLVSWLEQGLDAQAAADPHPGRVALHRLNRREYANAVRDLLALQVNAAELLPQDDTAAGFDNIASALQVSPSFLEQYVGAARQVAVRAVGQPAPRPGSRTYNVRAGTQQHHVPGLPLGTRGGALVEHDFPVTGEYVLNIADLAQALWVYNMEFENHLVVTLNGARIFETTIGGEDDMRAIDQDQDPAVDAINRRLKDIRFHAPAGPQQVGVTFVRRTMAESDDRLRPFAPGGGQDRVLRIQSFEISGPFVSEGLGSTPSRERIFSCYPDSDADARPCAQSIFARLARQAYRRPVNDADLAELMVYYDDGAASGGFEEGVRAALTGLLASPWFLYRADHIPHTLNADGSYRISDLEFASRLSFFLWSSLPDDELLELALGGELSDPAVREAQVRRMLADPRAESLATSFAHQWLHLDHLSEVNPDSVIFPYASGTADPRPHYLQEVMLFVDSIFREDRNVVELLSASYSYLNEPLALLYGETGVKGNHFRRVELSHSARRGLLGKGAVLMASSYPNRTAPVLRGAYILENILGTPPAPPLPDVEALQDSGTSGRDMLTVRELMARHSQDPSCFSCHGVMDPLGFALENFNAVGLWRDRDRFAGVLVDASGELPDGTLINGPDDLREALLRRPDQFVQTLTERLMTYALGRELTHHDMPVVRGIVRDAAGNDYRFSSLVLGIINSAPFTMRRVDADDAGAVTAAVTPAASAATTDLASALTSTPAPITAH